MTPDVAVVVPSRRGPRLAFLLDALDRQTVDNSRFEVVVVRDSQSSGADPKAPDGLAVRFVSAPGPCGPTVKRNLGWRASDAPLVAFTDDDCRPAPDWIECLVEAWGGNPRLFIQGRTEPDPDETHLLHGLARSQLIDGPSAWYQTCNMAYPRALLESLGGFDEDYEFGGEDTDLGARALRAGASAVWRPEALVWHGVIPRSPLRAIAEAARWPSHPLVLRRHPSYRSRIHYGMFWRPSHAAVILAATGLVAFRRHPLLAALATAPYVNMNLDRAALTPRGVARQLAALPARAAVDAVEVAAAARGAMRYRVPVL